MAAADYACSVSLCGTQQLKAHPRAAAPAGAAAIGDLLRCCGTGRLSAQAKAAHSLRRRQAENIGPPATAWGARHASEHSQKQTRTPANGSLTRRACQCGWESLRNASGRNSDHQRTRTAPPARPECVATLLCVRRMRSTAALADDAFQIPSGSVPAATKPAATAADRRHLCLCFRPTMHEPVPRREQVMPKRPALNSEKQP